MGHVTLYGNCLRKHSQCTCQWLETDSSNHIALQKVLLCHGLSYFKSPRVPVPLTIGFQSTSLFLCLFLSILLLDHHCHSHHGDHIEHVPLIAHQLVLHFRASIWQIKGMRSSVCVSVRAGTFEYRWLCHMTS